MSDTVNIIIKLININCAAEQTKNTAEKLK